MVFKFSVTVPDSKSGNIPEVIIVRRGQLGFWEFGKGGTVGWRVGQVGSVYKQPETEVDDSCHSWKVPSKWKGTQRGHKREARGNLQGEQGEQGEMRHVYIWLYCMCWRMIERQNVASIVYIIITRMSVVDNLNSV
jgi:hypothetical protein